MARPYWSGQITISLVSFGVKLFVATEAKNEIRFHQIDRATGERIRHQKVLASSVDQAPDGEEAKPVEKSSIVKGYEYEKGRYVTIEPEEIAHLRVPSKHAMEILQFVDVDSVSPAYFEKPYFVVPENDAQTEAFETVRKAMLDARKIALSKIAFGGREHVVALAPAGQDEHGGMMAYTMRYAAELRNEQDYFRDIRTVKVDEDSLDLAKQLIKKKTSTFDPSLYVDGYEVALKELVEAKLEHAPVPKDEAPAHPRAKVVNLMDALRKSVAADKGDAAKDRAEEDDAEERRSQISLVKGSRAATKTAEKKTKAAGTARTAAKAPAKTAKRRSA